MQNQIILHECTFWANLPLASTKCRNCAEMGIIISLMPPHQASSSSADPLPNGWHEGYIYIRKWDCCGGLLPCPSPCCYTTVQPSTTSLLPAIIAPPHPCCWLRMPHCQCHLCHGLYWIWPMGCEMPKSGLNRMQVFVSRNKRITFCFFSKLQEWAFLHWQYLCSDCQE